ncbi:MAG: hypothetical protein JWQ35_348 [Bacteriovoracaceae bacterium]|nr:hypothetical protein [Bacteriovoracaceae bacterium]
MSKKREDEDIVDDEAALNEAEMLVKNLTDDDLTVISTFEESDSMGRDRASEIVLFFGEHGIDATFRERTTYRAGSTFSIMVPHEQVSEAKQLLAEKTAEKNKEP